MSVGASIQFAAIIEFCVCLSINGLVVINIIYLKKNILKSKSHL